MRTELEIVAMYDRLVRDSLIFGERDFPAIVTLSWVCDRLVPDAEILAAADLIHDDDEDGELRPADIGASLIDTAADEDWNAWGEYLSREGGLQLKELAAAARKIDRMCKAEVKKRETNS